MGDGGCAVLVSQHPSAKFHSFRRDQGWVSLSYVPEHVGTREAVSDSERTSPVRLGLNRDISWPSVRICNMEPCRSSQGREVAEQRKEDSTVASKSNNADSNRRRRSTRWDIVDSECLSSARQLSAEKEERSCEWTTVVDRGAHVVPRTLRSDEFSLEQSRQTGEDQGETTVVHLLNERQSGLEPSAACTEGNGYFSSGAGGNVDRKESRTSVHEYYVGKSGLGPKEPRVSKWKDQDSASYAPGRVGWRAPKENGAGRSHYSGSSDGNREKDDAWYHHSERTSYGTRRQYHVRDKLHDGNPNSGHFENISHRSSSDRHGGSNTYGKDYDRSGSGRSYDRNSHGRDYVDRSRSRCTVSDKRGNSRNSFDRCAEKGHAGVYENRQQRRESDNQEFGVRKGHPRETKNWEAREGPVSADKMLDCFQNANQPHSLFSRGYRDDSRSAIQTTPDDLLNCEPSTAYRDESGSAGVQISMDLSPRPATVEDVSGRSCETSCNVSNTLSLNELTGSKLLEYIQEPEPRGWVYLDLKGITRGPVELDMLKQLLDNGILQSDHMVKLDGSNQWVTLERAVSPVTTHTSSVPPASSEQSALVLAQVGSPQQPPPVERAGAVSGSSSAHGREDEHNNATLDQASATDDLRIDERVEHLMEGFMLVAGKEKEAVSEALSHAARRVQQEIEIGLDNEESPRSQTGLAAHWREDQLIGETNILEGLGVDSQESKEPAGGTASANDPMDGGCVNSFQSTRKWTSRGGDWKLVCQPENASLERGQANAGPDRVLRLKLVLNEGFPLCEMRHSVGQPDPRREFLESSKFEAFNRRKLELPPWAYQLPEVKTEYFQKAEGAIENQTQSCQPSIATPKAQVSTPKSQSSTPVSRLSTPPGVAADPKKIIPGKLTPLSRLTGQHPEFGSVGLAVNNLPLLKCDSVATFRNMTNTHFVASGFSDEAYERINWQRDLPVELPMQEMDSMDLHQAPPGCVLDKSEFSLPSMNGAISSEKLVEQLARKEDLRLHDGEWYYKDGAGHENGPFLYAQLQLMVEQGSIRDGISVYRKSDELWVPLYSNLSSYQTTITSVFQDSYSSVACGSESSVLSVQKSVQQNATQSVSQVGFPPFTATGNRSSCSPYQSFALKWPQRDPPPPCLDNLIDILQPNHNQNQKHESSMSNIEESLSFHELYPQFMGYMRGKLHEHVMKSYKSRDFAGTLHEGLDKRFNDKQQRTAPEAPQVSPFGVPAGAPHVSSQNSSSSLSTSRPLDARSDGYNLKQDIEGAVNHLSTTFVSNTGFSSSRCEQNVHSKTLVTNCSDQPKHRRIRKRRRLIDVEASHIVGFRQSLQPSYTSDIQNGVKQDVSSLDSELETGSVACKISAEPETLRNWITLDSHVLKRVFCFLGDDAKSLVFASTTCKTWRTSFENFMKEARHIDLSSLGSLCTDAVLESFAASARRQICKLVLRDCLAISLSALRSLLRECPSMSLVDISGCDQLKELVLEFPRIKWIGPRLHEPPRKVKSLKLIGERKVPSIMAMEGFPRTHSSDDSVGKDRLVDEEVHTEGAPEPMDLDSSCCIDRDSDTSQIAQSHHLAKRARLNNAGKLKDESESCQKFARRDCAIVDTNLRETVCAPARERKRKQEPLSRLGKTAKNSFSGDRAASSKLKGDPLIRNGSCLDDTVKSVERYTCHQMAQILKTVKEADTKKFFSHQVPDGKGSMSLAGRALDFSAIEGKWKAGDYPGSMDGLHSFKDDLFLLCRSAFHFGQKGSPIFKAAEKIFKLAHRLVKKLEEDVSKAQNAKHIYSNGSLVKVFRGKSHRHQSGSNVVGRLDNIKRERASKRRGGMDETSADGESEDDYSEREGKRSSRSKKKQQRDWETSSSEDEEENLFEEEEDTDESELDMETESEGEDVAPSENGDSSADEAYYSDLCSRQWGARMTKASMVPPVTRKYDVIEEYVPVIDEEEVNKRMQLELPEDHEEKLQAAREKRGGEYSHLEVPDLKDYKPRKRLGDEVLEQEVYGIDPYTYNLLLDTMTKDRADFTDSRRQQLIEEELLCALNEEVKKFTGSGKAPMTYPLEPVAQRLVDEAKDHSTKTFYQALLRNMQSRPKDRYVAYRKGLGVVCNKQDGFEKDDFVVEFFGEVYPAWRWFEKQDAIRSFQKKEKDPAPEFYNIFLERPKGDAAGYDLVVVDAMHKANYASRICHSCRPNCEAKVTAVDGRYQIGVYTLRPVQYGEELTFDYNSVTESKEEYEASVCLCGSQGCRGSYLNFAGPGTFQEVMKESHGLLDRHHLLLEACAAGSPTPVDLYDLRQAGLGSCLLEGLPDWAIGYAARVVRFVNQERNRLPNEIIKTIVKERRLETYGDLEMFDAEVQADGVYNQRLQNLAITLDKVRYVLKKVYGDPTNAPPPLRKLEPAEVVSLIWKGENSVVVELLRGMENHLVKEDFIEFTRNVHEHDPVESENTEENLRKSLLWLRDELCKSPVTCLSRHDAAADIIHMYAYTKSFFTSQEYNSFESPPVTINSLDLGPKYAHALGSTSHEWKKTYGKDYVLGQLMFWYKQNVADPGSSLAKARRGCLALPDLSSCYAKSWHQDPRIAYGIRHRIDMFRRMERRPQKQWPKQELWEFKSMQRLFGSPMMDAVRQKTTICREMMDWLKDRPVVFEGPWDH